MNIQNMHIGVTLHLDRVASNANDGLLPEEIDYYLNRTIEDYILEQYNYLKTEQESIGSQQVLENLRTVLTTDKLALVSELNEFYFEFSLPDDYLYFVFAIYTSNNTSKNVTLLSKPALKPYLVTEYNTPLFREHPITIENDKVYLYFNSDGELLPELEFTYIKEPEIVSLENSINCNLPNHTHSTIVKQTAMNIARDLGYSIDNE